MATIAMEQITKVFPNGFKAVDSLDLTVAEGEFMVLVGPSGCGKTTVLRMIAGLEEITSGALRIGERVVNGVPARNRDIAMVFQSYALYPHMTVAQNIGFALRLRRLPKAEISKKVNAAADILGLKAQLGMRPAQLSGGQRQRVAMGRAIVREPVAFLMDEPLSNLDAKLRVQMRAEVSRIQRRLGVATVYVTHDQTEAMTMGDRVAVLNGGVLQQCDTPQRVYDRPDNLFVAAFIGSPAMNLYSGRLAEDGCSVRLGSQELALGSDVGIAHPGLARHRGGDVVVGLRPEHLGEASREDASRLHGDVELVEALGSELLVHFHVDAQRVHAELPGPDESDAVQGEGSLDGGELGAAAQSESVARFNPRSSVRPGDRITFAVDTTSAHFFDISTGKAIWD
ncbi:MAG: ABC transporter ATP-binding protein [Acidimicrobiales bacterium]